MLNPTFLDAHGDLMYEDLICSCGCDNFDYDDCTCTCKPQWFPLELGPVEPPVQGCLLPPRYQAPTTQQLADYQRGYCDVPYSIRRLSRTRRQSLALDRWRQRHKVLS